MLFLQPLASAVDPATLCIDQFVGRGLPEGCPYLGLVRRSRLFGTTAQGRVIGTARSRPNQLQQGGQKAPSDAAKAEQPPRFRAASIARSE